MANQTNYVTDLTVSSNNYKKFTVSRIVQNPYNTLIQTELPSTIPDVFDVEVSLYALVNNQRVYTNTFSSQSDSLGIMTFAYADVTSRKFLVFDFSKSDIQTLDGTFQLVLSFLVPTVGSLNTLPLRITKISPSRTELELQLSPQYKTNVSASQLRDFAIPQVNSMWAIDLLKYVCNQPNLNANIPTDKTPLLFDIIQEFLPPTQSAKITNPNVSGFYTQSIKNATQTLLNSTYNIATASIQALPPNTRLTHVLLSNILSSSVSQAIRTYTQAPTFTLV